MKKHDFFPISVVYAFENRGFKTIGEMKDFLDRPDAMEQAKGMRNLGPKKFLVAKELVKKYECEALLTDPQLINRTFIWNKEQRSMIESFDSEINDKDYPVYITDLSKFLRGYHPFDEVDQAIITLLGHGSDLTVIFQIDKTYKYQVTSEKMPIVSASEMEFYGIIRECENEIVRSKGWREYSKRGVG